MIAEPLLPGWLYIVLFGALGLIIGFVYAAIRQWMERREAEKSRSAKKGNGKGSKGSKGKSKGSKADKRASTKAQGN